MTAEAEEALLDDQIVQAWWIVADVRRAMKRGYLAGAPAGWLDCVRAHLDQIDDLAAELDASAVESAGPGADAR